jgi:hypothetical protein
MRADMLHQQDRVRLEELRHALARARARRADALKATSHSCRKLRVKAAEQVKEFRRAELARLALEVKALRQQARNECQARKHRIRVSGGRAVARKRELLDAEREHQAKMKRLAEDARKRRSKHAATSKERRQESDDHVRSNLPPELVPVFDRVARQIKGGPRTTRTEAFFEWAAENPEDVLRLQEHETERELAELVRQHEETSKRLRKGRAHYRALASETPF